MEQLRNREEENYSVPKPSKLDQFYTKPSIVEHVLTMVDCERYNLVVEPSAGAGDFFDRLPSSKRVGIDLSPANAGIQKGDFLDFVPETTENVLTVGNPPFGKNSSLAVKFFNHAAQFSDCIAFIVPRTFRKPSVINRLHTNFHLVEQEILPLDSFYTPSGESYMVPTVFQVWEKRKETREVMEILTTHSDFEFLGTDAYSFSDVDVTLTYSSGYYEQPEKQVYKMSKTDLAEIKELRKKYPKLFSAHRIVTAKKTISWNTTPDFAWRRAGARAGEVFDEYKNCPTEGFEFIKVNNKAVVHVFKKMWNTTWNPNTNSEKIQEKWDTAGQASISKHELIKFYEETKNNE